MTPIEVAYQHELTRIQENVVRLSNELLSCKTSLQRDALLDALNSYLEQRDTVERHHQPVEVA